MCCARPAGPRGSQNQVSTMPKWPKNKTAASAPKSGDQRLLLQISPGRMVRYRVRPAGFITHSRRDDRSNIETKAGEPQWPPDQRKQRIGRNHCPDPASKEKCRAIDASHLQEPCLKLTTNSLSWAPLTCHVCALGANHGRMRLMSPFIP